eukprot:augustus_masked-scaffold_1-processed-gene-14.44-mRNA-1 protein AED:1.00 eAED:1.00 QI:0/0/0/0/1/1/2/0/926
MFEVLPDFEGEMTITPVFTVGEQLPSSTETQLYTPPGVLDGMGAWRVDETTVRVYSNHEINHNAGYEYSVCGDLDCESTYNLTGARISYFDFDVESLQVKESGVAYKYVYGSDGTLQADSSWLDIGNGGFARFCSAQFVAGYEYGFGRGIENSIQFGPEENGQAFSPFGGHYWALDIIGKGFWRVPALGRGSWESITQIDTNTDNYVAFVMPDDTSPLDFGGTTLASPLYLYVGEKQPESSDFLRRNGLRDGTIYVFVPDDSSLDSPETFSGTGNSQPGTWVPIDTAQREDQALDELEGFFMFDSEGFATQLNQWLQANAAGAFKFSRPEDISTYSKTGNEFVVTSTGITGFNGTDSFGTIYTMELFFEPDGTPLPADLVILIDADADIEKSLRSPDNLDWASDSFVYVQEDRAITQTPDGEPLFGDGAVNQNEALLIRIDGTKLDGVVTKLAQVDRSVILDASLEDASAAVDVDAGDVGAWETTGIIEVSQLFGKEEGTLFLANVQAHGIEDQDQFNAESRIHDGDLVEGGQMVIISFATSVSGASEIVGTLSGLVFRSNEERQKLLTEIKSRGNAAFKIGSLLECDVLYSKAIELCKDEDKTFLVSLLSNRSMVYSKLGKFDEAEKDANKLVSLDESNPKAYFRLATALKGLKKFDESIKNFEKVISLDSKNKRISSEIDAVKKAKEKYEKELKEKPKEKSVPVTSTPKNVSSVGSKEKKSEKNDMRGYKVLPNGKKTTFFNMERTKEEIELINKQTESKPQRLETDPEEHENSETGGSAWNKKGTFEEKDLNTWAKDKLKKYLRKIELSEGDFDFKVEKIKNLEGDASQTFTRGQQRKIFDFSFVVCVEVFTETNSTNVDLFVSDFSGDSVKDDDIEFEVRWSVEQREKVKKEEAKIISLLKSNFWNIVKENLVKWTEEFEEL